MVSVADRRRQRLVEKSEFRPMQKVMAKAPIGAATLQSAPKLSDFRDLPLSERVKAHEKALQHAGRSKEHKTPSPYTRAVSYIYGCTVY